jgi:hypothetical protein
MPTLEELLAKGQKRKKPSTAQTDDPGTTSSTENALAATAQSVERKRISRGVRPDHVARGIEKTSKTTNAAEGRDRAFYAEKASYPISPANDQHIASISPANIENALAKSPANDQHIASIPPAAPAPVSPAYRQQEKREKDPASISPAKSPANGQQQASKQPAYRQHTASKSPAKYEVSSLSGREAQLVKLIFQHCRVMSSRTTEPISSEETARLLQISTKRLNNVVERLVAKQVLTVVAQKPGRGAWRRFCLSDEAYHQSSIHEIASKSPALHHQIASTPPANREQIASKQPAIAPAMLSSSSGSDLDPKATTAREPEGTLPTDWLAVDVTPLSPIGFTQTHVRQLHRAGLLTAEELQDSIFAFAFDLEVNGKAKKLNGSPLNFFMGCLRKGPYAPPENFEAPEVRQRRLYLEAKEKAAKTRRELEEKLEALEFEEWLSKLSLVERTQLVPASEFAKPGSTAHNVELRRHFREQVWPRIRMSPAQSVRIDN